MLKIQRSANGRVVFILSGRMQKMPSPYLWPAPADPCTSASDSVPLSFATAATAFPGAELNFSRPVAGDTKTREFEKVAT